MAEQDGTEQHARDMIRLRGLAGAWLEAQGRAKDYDRDGNKRLADYYRRVSWHINQISNEPEGKTMDSIGLLKSYGYAVSTRTEAEASGRMPAGLKERMAGHPGTHIVFDPQDDDQGFCVVGDDPQALAAEAVEHLGLEDEK
jgi:hypothetical protein